MDWRRTATSTPDAKTGPMWGHPKGSHYVYTFTRNASPQDRGKRDISKKMENLKILSYLQVNFQPALYG